MKRSGDIAFGARPDPVLRSSSRARLCCSSPAGAASGLSSTPGASFSTWPSGHREAGQIQTTTLPWSLKAKNRWAPESARALLEPDAAGAVDWGVRGRELPTNGAAPLIGSCEYPSQ